MRNYGRIIQNMIEQTAHIEDISERQDKTIFIARCMRLKNQIWNQDKDSGIQRLREDIRIISGGKLATDFPGFEEALSDELPAIESNQSKNQKKKKKR